MHSTLRRDTACIAEERSEIMNFGMNMLIIRLLAIALILIGIILVAGAAPTDNREIPGGLPNDTAGGITGMMVAPIEPPKCPACEPQECVKYEFFEAPFMETAKRIATTPYVRHEYDCDMFAADLRDALRKEGWAASSYKVRVNCSTGIIDCGPEQNPNHMITLIAVAVESTDGTIIPPEKYEAYGIDVADLMR